jgi:hypothetical protein
MNNAGNCTFIVYKSFPNVAFVQSVVFVKRKGDHLLTEKGTT